jgi:hypothetical protein
MDRDCFVIGSPGTSAAHRIAAEALEGEDDLASVGSGEHWVVVLASVAAIAWLTFIVLLALFVTTSTA